ncbi:MAG: 3-oxoacid CoA-transferase [Alphaproteobacteria bacterium]|nr:3-oxoacid CoA-transferase [Alphaproteobacteria bacterium]MBU1561526.1 3-oxoacid CoA-transferase [Alphaproteobacteria bacterium]MBU2302641.1 3-oxoacid CoA-transferase [Alphaproteobacteria bacterium]MBU2367715.1 3-oxoacid CoA-transferase [Alphaproteobacteria bacterium]
MKVISAAEAAALVGDGDTILIGGSGGGHSVPDALMAAVEQRFVASAQPRNICAIHPVGLGDRVSMGASRFARAGLLKRIVCGALVDSPAVAAMAISGDVEAYTLPQGVLSQLVREIAAGRPGLFTHVGLHTFVDPRKGGGRQSETATESLVEVVELGGREWLFYKPFNIDVAFIRGTTSDEDGNISMEHEAVYGEMLSMAQAARNCGGIVIAQVKRMAARNSLPAKSVKVPGMLVDAVVLVPDQSQTFRTQYDAAYAGEIRVPASSFPRLQLDARKVVARRAALELRPNAICNIGSGISTGLPLIAAEEDVLDRIILTNEQGVVGGIPVDGYDFGAGRNYSALIDQPYQFDFYDGGGIDLAYLSAAEIDREGNVNVSRFADKIIGIGGFVNISQGSKKVMFSGTFTAGGLEVECVDGGLRIVQEGRNRKFVEKVNQISFSGRYSAQRGQQILFLTERAVFRLNDGELELIEIAKGIALEEQVLGLMDFMPRISPHLKLMDERLFRVGAMGLKADLAAAAESVHPKFRALADGVAVRVE